MTEVSAWSATIRSPRTRGDPPKVRRSGDHVGPPLPVDDPFLKGAYESYAAQKRPTQRIAAGFGPLDHTETRRFRRVSRALCRTRTGDPFRTMDVECRNALTSGRRSAEAHGLQGFCQFARLEA